MNKKIVVEQSLNYRRTALVGLQGLEKVYLEDLLNPDYQGQVIQGQVDQVMKDLKAVFVDYGQEKKGLLPFKQIPEVYEGKIQKGFKLPIQVTKENLGEKGHKLTAFINLPGQYVVCLPFEDEIGVSKKIKDEELRKQLKSLVEETRTAPYGFIVRTGSAQVEVGILKKEIIALCHQADLILQKREAFAKGNVIEEGQLLVIKLIQNALQETDEVDVLVDQLELFERINGFSTSYGLENRIHIEYKPEEDLFSICSLEHAFENLLKRRVWLKNGGNLIIEQTEAMTVIDVNSAKSSLAKSKKEQMMKLNQLAFQESMRQIVGRNLSGMIMIDLVDLQKEEDRKLLDQYIKEWSRFEKDKRTTFYPITPLGLLQISREKEYASLSDKVFEPCKLCEGRQGNYRMSYALFLLEKHLKKLKDQTVQKAITIECTKAFLEYLQKYDLINKLEAYYYLEIKCQQAKLYEKTNFKIIRHA